MHNQTYLKKQYDEINFRHCLHMLTIIFGGLKAFHIFATLFFQGICKKIYALSLNLLIEYLPVNIILNSFNDMKRSVHLFLKIQ